ncbi:MAG: cysteine synthase A [Oscillospiraceae bacterium]|nr:cysteine synthase A [Oscillospiraceae bacterium]
MAKIFSSADQLIGGTPLLELRNIEKELGLGGRLLAKLEYLNPAGSVKDRVAKNMLDEAENAGTLTPGTVIIEPTSGNTGIGLASVAAARGYRLIIVMPDSMSEERRLIMGAYGAELVLSDGSLGMSGAIAKAEQLHRELPGSIIAGQFTNSANPRAHYLSTGPEIWRDTDGELGCFVAGVGTGGTITGTGRYLKEMDGDIRVVAVEPENSAVLSGGKPGKHGLQGIGAGFIPEILDTGIYDEIMTVSDAEAYAAARLLGRREGVLAGISSGAALHAGIALARRSEYAGKNIVVLLPDTGDRYLSTGLFSGD